MLRGNLSITSSSVKQSKKNASPSKIGLIGCPRTSVTNYQSMLYNIPEEQSSYFISLWVSVFWTTGSVTTLYVLIHSIIGHFSIFGEDQLVSWIIVGLELNTESEVSFLVARMQDRMIQHQAFKKVAEFRCLGLTLRDQISLSVCLSLCLSVFLSLSLSVSLHPPKRHKL
jgi:hypothetical protein